MFKFKVLSFVLSTVALTTTQTAYSKTPGVTDTEIKLGMSNATSGPAEALGAGVKKGAQVYLDKINKSGGIHGRKVVIVHKDDGYEPKMTVKNTKKFIKEDEVFSLFSYVGTPTSKAVIPMITRNRIPYISPFTGAEFLRSPVKPDIFNVRSSYNNETDTLVERFTKDLGFKKIGVFIQNDGYGNAGKSGVVKALKKRGLKLWGEGRYKRNTTDVEAGLNDLLSFNKKEPAEAVIIVGAYKACAAFMKAAHAKGYKPRFANISFVGTMNLIKESGKAGEGSFISQVMPQPNTSKLEIVKQYQKDMKAAGHSDFAYTSLEGYINAVVLVEGLKKAGKDLTRDKFRKAMETIDQSFGGLGVKFNAKKHQGLSKVYLTQVVNGKPVEVENFK